MKFLTLTLNAVIQKYKQNRNPLVDLRNEIIHVRFGFQCSLISLRVATHNTVYHLKNFEEGYNNSKSTFFEGPKIQYFRFTAEKFPNLIPFVFWPFYYSALLQILSLWFTIDNDYWSRSPCMVLWVLSAMIK